MKTKESWWIDRFSLNFFDENEKHASCPVKYLGMLDWKSFGQAESQTSKQNKETLSGIKTDRNDRCFEPVVSSTDFKNPLTGLLYCELS